MKKFDPYHRWLGIPPQEQPPTLYQLLGLSNFESSREVIRTASQSQVDHVKQYAQVHPDAANKILNELARAQVILLNPQKKSRYDKSIQGSPQKRLQTVTPVFPTNPRVKTKPLRNQQDAPPVEPRQPKQNKLLLIGIPVLTLSLLANFGMWWVLSSDEASAERVAKTSATTTTAATIDLAKPEAGLNQERKTSAQPATIPNNEPLAETSEPEKSETSKADTSEPKLDNKPKPKTAAANEDHIRAHSDFVSCVAFSPDSEQIISCSWKDGTLKLWDAMTKNELRQFAGHQGGMSVAAFSPDGKKIVSGGRRYSLKLWDAVTGQQLQDFKGRATFNNRVEWFSSLAYSPNGQLIATGESDRVSLWDPSTLKQLHAMDGPTLPFRAIAFSPDSHQLATGGGDNVVRLYDCDSGAELQTFTGHSKTIKSIAFSPDGKQIISGGKNHEAILWDIASGKKLHTFKLDYQDAESLMFIRDGKRVASVTDGGTLQVFDVDTGKASYSLRFNMNVSGVSFSPDQKHFVVGDYDGLMEVFDIDGGAGLTPVPFTLTALGKTKFRLSAKKQAIHRREHIGLGANTVHTDTITSVAFSPDGQQIISSSADGTFKVWDSDSETVLSTFRIPKNTSWQVAISSNGKFLISGGNDKKINLLNAETGRIQRTLYGHTDTITSLAFSPDGMHVVSGSKDKTIKLWDLFKEEVLQTLEGHTDVINSVCYSSDGKFIVSGGADTAIKLWDAVTGEELKNFAKQSGPVESVAFSRDGQQVIGLSGDTVTFWDSQSGQELRVFGKSGSLLESVSMSPDGMRVACGDSDGTVKIWDTENGAELKSLNFGDAACRAAFAPDGQRLVVCFDKSIKVLDISNSSDTEPIQSTTLRGHRGDVGEVAFSSDGKLIVSASDDESLILWDANNAKLLRRVVTLESKFKCVRFTPDDKSIFSGTEKGDVKVRHLADGEVFKSFYRGGKVSSIAISPNGKRIAFCGQIGRFRLVRYSNKLDLSPDETATQHDTSVAFSPKGNWVVSGNLDNTIKIWNANSGKLRKNFTGHTDGVLSVAYSPDGKQVISGSRDNTIKVWGVAKGEAIRTLAGHTGFVHSVAFSPDGKLIASGSADRKIKLWDAVTGNELRSLSGHTDDVRCVVFSPDGKKLVSSSNDDTIKIWNVAGMQRIEN